MKKIHEPKGVIAGLGASVSGRFTLAIKRGDGGPLETVADFPNLILDSGLKLLLGGLTSNVAAVCSVGTSSAPEAAEQVALVSPLSGFSPAATATVDKVGGSPFLITHTNVYTFVPGKATGVLAEIGTGPQAIASASYPLFCRARIRDAGGEPMTITVAPDDTLVVTYVLSTYVDVADKSFTLNLSSGAHDCVMRRSHFPAKGAFTGGLHPGYATQGYPRAWNGPLLDISDVTNPAGFVTADWVSVGGDAVGSSTSHRDWTYKLPLLQGNLPTGSLTALQVPGGNFGQYQISFNPPLPKTADKEFNITLRFSIGRA